MSLKTEANLSNTLRQAEYARSVGEKALMLAADRQSHLSRSQWRGEDRRRDHAVAAAEAARLRELDEEHRRRLVHTRVALILQRVS